MAPILMHEYQFDNKCQDFTISPSSHPLIGTLREGPRSTIVVPIDKTLDNGPTTLLLTDVDDDASCTCFADDNVGYVNYISIHLSTNPLQKQTKPTNPLISFPTMSPLDSDTNDKGATGAAKFVTSTVGNTVGGLGKTVGGIVGAGGIGLGQTVTGATGSAGKPIGDALESLGEGVESGVKNVSQGVEDAGKWK
ncbi:MAG: hypothetical protein L6R39_004669 [Caloplaca ligustica]|nr:MAG: hypothetical protein L6R39_004669 [Caloplaca ligustica]